VSRGPYFVYIVASRSRTLYIGITGNLRRRIFEHKLKLRGGFTARYNCNRLVWFQQFEEVTAAIDREKELKGWLRAKKKVLIESKNPTWEDLSVEWYQHLDLAKSQLEETREADPSRR
jgi:putative endonuclease